MKTSKSPYFPLVFCLLFIVLSNHKLNGQNIEDIGKVKPIRLSGTLSVLGGPYSYIGNGLPRNDPFWWQINGSPTLSVYGWQLPFSFNYGSVNRSFTQPFNRYGVSPYWRWLTFHFGYRSIRMNSFVMSGLQFLGAGIEMNPKGFRFAAFYGRFAKPIARDTMASITPIPAFARIGYGVKIGVGSRINFVDFTFVKVADEIGSIPSLGLNLSLKPQDNLLFGLSSRITFNRHFNFQLELGASALNRDLNLPLSDSSSKFRQLRGLFEPHLGFQLLTAGQASIQYFQKYFGVKLQVRRVDPDYRSLAAFYQQSDLQAITIEPSMRLLKNKLRISGSIGKQQDNLYGRKAFTSIRNIGSINMSANISKEYTVGLNFSNYGIAQQNGLQVLKDTFRVAQNNRTIGLSQQYMLLNKIRTLSLSMNLSYQQLVDLNPYGTYSSAENRVWNLNLNGSRIRVKDNLSIMGGFNFSNNQFSNGSYMLIGPVVGISKPFVKNKLQLTTNLSYNKGLQQKKTAGNTLNFYSAMQYQVNKSHQFSLTLNLLQNSTPFLNAGNFIEVRLLAGYVLSLQPKY